MMSEAVGGIIRGLLQGFETDVRCVVKDVGEFRLVELVDGNARRVLERSPRSVRSGILRRFGCSR